MRINQTDISKFIGAKFGILTVISAGTKKHYLKCLCGCGVEKDVYKSSLIHGKTKTCGCKSGEFSKSNVTHGMSKTKTYQTWQHMKARCYRVSSKDYKNWGGRGISVCERWHKFENFLEDMGECPRGMSIDRIDNDGNYEPSNCRWATSKEQTNNTRQNVLIEYNGQIKTIGEWGDLLGIKAQTLKTRILCGWSIKDAFEIKANAGHVNKLIEFNGEKKSLKSHARDAHIKYGTVFSRISRGWSIEKALTK